MAQPEYEKWIAEAKNDFEVGEILDKSEKYNAAAFYYVQAAEKAVKSILHYYGQQPWGHSINSLLLEYENLGHVIDHSVKNAGKIVEPHYITSRYPDATPDLSPKDYYTAEMVERIRDAASIILTFIEDEMEGISHESESEGI
ncbi:MAG TPA: HEPN domain-containing protein [Candidatus Lokiarchaeia archaeon]|nr:HEPN domain-containing protein [Candidatus Lokiarchaeia archaeon]